MVPIRRAWRQRLVTGATLGSVIVAAGFGGVWLLVLGMLQTREIRELSRVGALGAAQTEDDVFAELHAGLFDDLTRLNLLCSVGSFFYPLQNRVITTFQPHMNTAQTCFPKKSHIEQPLLNDIV